MADQPLFIRQPHCKIRHSGMHQPSSCNQILQLHRAGIRGLYQQEDCLVVLPAQLRKGANSISAQITVDGNAVAVKG